MTEHQLELLKKMGDGLMTPVPLILSATADPRTDAFRRFGDLLAGLAPRVMYVVTTSDTEEKPFFKLGSRWRLYMVPQGNELECFTKMLLSMSGKEPSQDPALKARMEAVLGSPRVTVFVSPQCPFCPAALNELISLVHFLEGSEATVIDASLFPEPAREAGVKSVPTVIVNDEYRFTGGVSLTEILEVLEHEDPSCLTTEALRRILKEGRAGRLAAMMLSRGHFFPAFAPLLTDGEWSVRLGAMVVVEELAEKDPSLVRHVPDMLWNRFAQLDLPVRGDLVYLTGLAGADDRWISHLESLLESPESGGLEDVILEALETLRNKS